MPGLGGLPDQLGAVDNTDARRIACRWIGRLVTCDMLKTSVVLCVLAASFSSCVPMPKWQSPSGNPEVVAKGAGVKGRVLSRMVSKQWEVKSESDHTLTFERQQLGAGNRAVFAMSGDMMGILDGWNVVLIPESDKTRVVLASTYVNTKTYGKTTNPATQKAGDEFIATLSGL